MTTTQLRARRDGRLVSGALERSDRRSVDGEHLRAVLDHEPTEQLVRGEDLEAEGFGNMRGEVLGVRRAQHGCLSGERCGQNVAVTFVGERYAVQGESMLLGRFYLGVGKGAVHRAYQSLGGCLVEALHVFDEVLGDFARICGLQAMATISWSAA